MDPNVTCREILAALNSHDLVAAHEHATNLLEWLNKGGFPPHGIQRLGLTRAGLTHMVEAIAGHFAPPPLADHPDVADIGHTDAAPTGEEMPTSEAVEVEETPSEEVIDSKDWGGKKKKKR